MRKLFLFLSIFICTSAIDAQSTPSELEGKWMGKLGGGADLRIVFNLEIIHDTINATLDSPDQGIYGIETGSTTLTGTELNILIPAIQGSFKGNYIADSLLIRGVWIQGGSFLPLSLTKTDSVEPIFRLQNPVKPYAYKQEEVVFQNKDADSVFLAGTITIPEGEGPFSAVILVSGSGPQNRDEFLLGHSPFLVLSDRFTKAGILVLRYDDRGVAQSTGDHFSATSLDFSSDASAAVDYLKSRTDLNINMIGIAGHSEGGLIAPLTATENKNVDFIILMAGPGIPGDSILNLQGDLIARASGFSDSMVFYYNNLRRSIVSLVKQETDLEILRNKIIAINKKFIAETPTNILLQMQITASDTITAVDFYANNWTKYFIDHDPQPVLEKLAIPVLAINGTKDLQVPYYENLSAIAAALEKSSSPKFKTLELEGLNHLFQRSETGAPSEYALLDETFNEDAMIIMIEWIKSL